MKGGEQKGGRILWQHPGYFFYIGATPPGEDSVQLHTPLFNTDDKTLILGVRAMSNLAIDYLNLKR
jgi:metal-dependent amidase/aminoacylase/carboxypeptidase family protein